MYLYKDCELISEHLLGIGVIDNYLVWISYIKSNSTTEDNTNGLDHVDDQNDIGDEEGIGQQMFRKQ
jgi:hypothetical protein